MSSSLLVDSPPKLCTLRARVDTGYRAAAAGAPVIVVHPVPHVSLCVTQAGWSNSIAWVTHPFCPAAGSRGLGSANNFVVVDNVGLLLLSVASKWFTPAAEEVAGCISPLREGRWR